MRKWLSLANLRGRGSPVRRQFHRRQSVDVGHAAVARRWSGDDGVRFVAVAERGLGQPYYYFTRQAFFVGAGLLVAFVTTRIPLALFERYGAVLLFAALALLVVVLVPGVGREVNGSTRWFVRSSTSSHRSSPSCAR